MPAGPMMPSMARLGSTCKMTCRWWKSFEGQYWAQDGLSIYIYNIYIYYYIYIYNGQIGGMLSIHFHNDLIWHLYTNFNDAGMTINIHKPYSIFWMAHLGFWPQGPWRSLTEFTKHGDSNGDWSNKRFATDRLSGHLFRIWQQWFGFFETCLTCKKVTGCRRQEFQRHVSWTWKKKSATQYHGFIWEGIPHSNELCHVFSHQRARTFGSIDLDMAPPEVPSHAVMHSPTGTRVAMLRFEPTPPAAVAVGCLQHIPCMLQLPFGNQTWPQNPTI